MTKIDKELITLCNIKILINNSLQTHFRDGNEITEIIFKIEELCKYRNNNKYILEIKKKIRLFYENRGRDEYLGIYKYHTEINVFRDIIRIIENAKIPPNYEVISILK